MSIDPRHQPPPGVWSRPEYEAADAAYAAALAADPNDRMSALASAVDAALRVVACPPSWPPRTSSAPSGARPAPLWPLPPDPAPQSAAPQSAAPQTESTEDRSRAPSLSTPQREPDSELEPDDNQGKGNRAADRQGGQGRGVGGRSQVLSGGLQRGQRPVQPEDGQSAADGQSASGRLSTAGSGPPGPLLVTDDDRRVARCLRAVSSLDDAAFLLAVYRASLAAPVPSPEPELPDWQRVFQSSTPARTSVARHPDAPASLYGKVGVALFQADAAGLRAHDAIALVGNAAWEWVGSHLSSQDSLRASYSAGVRDAAARAASLLGGRDYAAVNQQFSTAILGLLRTEPDR